MTVFFYVLWVVAIARAVLTPFFLLVKKSLFILIIGIGIWLLVGVSVYQTKYAEYEARRSQLQEKIDMMYGKKRKLESLLLTHPSSRDVLLSLADLAYRLHDQETLQRAIDQLYLIDPNSPKVRQLQRTIQ